MKRWLFDIVYRQVLSKNVLLPFVKDLRYIFVFHDISPANSDHNHPVYSTDFDHFKRLVYWVRSNFELVSLDVLTDEDYQRDSPQKLASIVFDDGFASVLEFGFPFFKQENIPFAVFASQTAIQENWLWCSNLFMALKRKDIAYLGKVYDQLVATSGIRFEEYMVDPVTCLSNNRLLTDDYSIFDDPQYTNKKAYLNEGDIKFLHSSEVIIGNHTKTHKHLSTCSPESIRQEILGNKSYLEGLLDCEIKHFALPFGFYTTYNDYAIEVAMKTHPFVYDTEKNRLRKPLQKLIPRICLTNDEIPTILSYVNYPIIRNLNN